MNPWTPELEVTPELAESLIRANFPELGPVRLRVLDSGWDNVVYEVNGQWFFRFPQREMAVAGVRLEIECLPALSSALVRVPELKFEGRPSGSYPWPYFGYRPVEGFESCDLPLQQADRAGIARPLAVLLSKLHSVEMVNRIQVELPRDPLGRLDFGRRIPMTQRRLDEQESQGVALPFAQLRQVLEAARTTPKLPHRAVVHGDLHFRHLILNEHKSLSGLIDWGDIHLNDPAIDLQLYWSFLPPECRGVFREAYGPVSAVQLIQARSFAVFVNTALLEYARKEGKPAVEREAMYALHNLLVE